MTSISKKSTLAMVLAAAMIQGCATTQTPQSSYEVAEQQIEMEKKNLELQQRLMELEQKRLEAELDSVPEWVLAPPKPDGTGIYATGIADSKKLQTVIRKARLQAEFELAKQYKQEISGSERAFEQDNGDDMISEQYTALIDKLVERVPVNGYQIVEQEIIVKEGRYHGYVLMKLPYDEFNAVLQQQKRSEQNDQVVAAFDDLEQRLEKRRKERLAEERLDFERKDSAADKAHAKQMEKAQHELEVEKSRMEGERQLIEARNNTSGAEEPDTPKATAAGNGINIKL